MIATMTSKATNHEAYDEQQQEQEQQQTGSTTSFRFEIPVLETDGCSSSHTNNNHDKPSVPQELIDSFQRDGFCVFPDVVSNSAVEALNDRLEDVLRGIYDRGRKPDKVPKLIKAPKPIQNSTTSNNTIDSKKHKKKTGMGPIGFSGNFQNVKVLQIINIHKADSLFRRLETNATLAQVVSQLAGWEHYGGARLAQDQFWGKPPNAPPLVFHRDSPYFMFDPAEVVTVWIALDDMTQELGPLEYVVGSHKWGDGRIGSANQFFQQDTKSLLWSAAEREGIPAESLQFVSMADKLRAGGLSIHHGKIWHGSAKNSSKTNVRRGLGLHFVPANVKFTAEASKSRLWKSYVEGVEDPSQMELCKEDFPLSTE